MTRRREPRRAGRFDEPKRPDIVLYCDDGHDEFVVQRFRWLGQQGVWVGTRKATAEVPLGADATPALPRLGVEAVHGQWPLSCPRCRRTCPARSERLCYVLEALTTEGQRRVSLRLLPELLKLRRADDIGADGLQYPTLRYPPL